MSIPAPLAAGRTRTGIIRHLSGRDWIATSCAIFLILIVLIAVFAPWIAPDNPNTINLLDRWQAPSSAHLLGTDALGRDILSRLIWGAASACSAPSSSSCSAVSFGTFIAITAAWMGGWFDTISSRALDILFAFPGLILALLAVALFGTGLVAPVLALSLAYLPYISRVLRSGAFKERQMPYIAAATVEGLPSRTDRVAAPAAEHHGARAGAGDTVIRLCPRGPGSRVVPGARRAAPCLGVGPHGGHRADLDPQRASPGVPVRRSVHHRDRGRLQRPGRPARLPPLGRPIMSLLEIEHLGVDLPVEGSMQTVIHEVTLSIAEGEAVGLVGESGAGKSMTSRAVIRLLPPGAEVRGDIRFAGDSILAMDRAHLRGFRMSDVGMIFQDPRAHINPVRTIGDFLTESLITNFDVLEGGRRGRGHRPAAGRGDRRRTSPASSSIRSNCPGDCSSAS